MDESLAADAALMRRALHLAARARGQTSPNPMVAAVVVRRGRVVGEGFHHRAGEPHAEALALAQAGAQARGATLYVALEPCCHHGPPPPCTEAVIRAGIARVVAACEDPNPRVSGQGLHALRKAGIQVECGLLAEEARRLNEAYFTFRTTGLPFVFAQADNSPEGKIATATRQSRWITSERARAYVHRLRSWYDAVMVGVGTVLADDPLLTVRVGRARRQPLRVVV